MIFILILIAFALRLISLNQSLWLDEGINVLFARSLSYRDLLTQYPLGDFHPPLYHLILKAFTTIFSTSEISSRMPSIMFGTLTVYVVYLIGKKIYDEKTALIGATLMATAPLHIYYSQEARMYALAAFLTSLSVYFFLSIIDKDKIHLWVGFVLSTVLMLYSDYLPYLMVPIYIIYLIIFRNNIRKSTLVSFIPGFILILILITPWLLFLPKQLGSGLSASAASPAWAQVVGSPSLNSFLITFTKLTIGRISADDNVTYFLLVLPIAIFVLGLFALHLFRMSTKRAFLLFWFFLPIVFAFGVSFLIPIFAYFRLLYVLGAFYLIWASAINSINWHKPTRLFLALALLINLICSSIYFLNPKFQREDWKSATNYIQTNLSSNSIVLFESNFTFAPFDYYKSSNIKAVGVLNNWNPTQDEVSKNVNEAVSNADKVFLFQYLSPITDPQGLVYEELTKQHFINTSTQDFQGVGFVYEFKKF